MSKKKRFWEILFHIFWGYPKKESVLFKKRLCCFEPLDARELLSISPPNFPGSAYDNQTEYTSQPFVLMPKADFYQVNYGDILNVNIDSSVLANDSIEGDGGIITDLYSVQINESTKKGSVILHADGTFSYTANAGCKGTDVFTYNILDQDGEIVGTSSVIIEITPQGTGNGPGKPLSPGYNTNPNSNDFGKLSVGGNGTQISPTQAFIPSGLDTFVSSQSATRDRVKRSSMTKREHLSQAWVTRRLI